MKSKTPGTDTLPVEVTNISAHGFWLIMNNEELFLPFEDFPWFQDAPVRSIINVELPHPHHLYWPDLDVDLTVEIIKHPEKYPLKSK